MMAVVLKPVHVKDPQNYVASYVSVVFSWGMMTLLVNVCVCTVFSWEYATHWSMRVSV